MTVTGATIWNGPIPPAEELERMWIDGKLPPGIYPPISIILKYSPVEDDESGPVPDDTKRYSGTYY